MADKKINDLVLGTVSESMQVETDIGGTTANKINLDQIKTFANTNISCLSLDTTYVGATGEGEFCWNSDEGTANLGLAGGNVNLQIGQEILLPRGKATGSDIDNGQIVYISGASGSKPELTLAQANSTATASSTIAMATEDITQNSNGYYTAFGLVRDIPVPTATFSDGDIIYLSADTAGAFTNVKPEAPNIAVRVGFVIVAHNTAGTVFVNIDQRTNNYINIRGLTSQSIPYADSNGFLTEDNTNFNWNNSSSTLTTVDDFNLQCGTDKTLELQESVYKDINIGGVSLRSGASNQPSLINFDTTTILVSEFSNGQTNEVHGAVEVQHDYKEGSDLVAHVHWYPTNTDTGDVRWGLEYTVEGDTGTVVSGTLTTNATASGTAWQEQLSNIGTISGTGITIGCQLHFRLFRDGSDIADTYDDGATIATFGVHYEVDTLGSRQIATK